MSKLYFALRPDSDACDEILEVGRHLAFEHDLAEPYGAEYLHLSLNGIGAFNLDLADRAIAAGDSIWAPPVEITLDRIALYNGEPKPLVLEADATDPLKTLFGMLAESMVQNGLAPHRQFEPHVTLLKDDRAPEQATLARPIRWVAEEFVLIHSDGYHELIASWPLRG